LGPISNPEPSLPKRNILPLQDSETPAAMVICATRKIMSAHPEAFMVLEPIEDKDNNDGMNNDSKAVHHSAYTEFTNDGKDYTLGISVTHKKDGSVLEEVGLHQKAERPTSYGLPPSYKVSLKKGPEVEVSLKSTIEQYKKLAQSPDVPRHSDEVADFVIAGTFAQDEGALCELRDEYGENHDIDPESVIKMLGEQEAFRFPKEDIINNVLYLDYNIMTLRSFLRKNGLNSFNDATGK